MADTSSGKQCDGGDGGDRDDADDADLAALLDHHAAAHAALEAAFFEVLEALSALETASALARWRQLAEAVVTHHGAEDEALLPLLGDEASPPRGASARIQGPEHARLVTLLAEGGAVLELLAAAPSEGLRARVVRAFGPLLRVQHLLEHHHTRERDLIYPFAAPRLAPEARRRLRQGLAAGLARLDA
jgi:hypothetical protein